MLPANHALRSELNDEVHARPSDSIQTPSRISYLVLSSETGARDAEWDHLMGLITRFGGAKPARPVNHFSLSLGRFSVRWERHTEFTRYTFIAPGGQEDPFESTALQELPGEWVASIPGQLMVASHGALLAATDTEPNYDAIANRWFGGNMLVGSRVGDDAAIALTDFRVRSDGFSRFLLIDTRLTWRQAGRTVQRILEIDTDRMMALLESMNRRAKAQSKLQQTVEGLSVAAVISYIVGLVGYLAKGVKSAGAPINPELVTAISIPLVIDLSAPGIRRIRNAIAHKTP